MGAPHYSTVLAQYSDNLPDSSFVKGYVANTGSDYMTKVKETSVGNNGALYSGRSGPSIADKLLDNVGRTVPFLSEIRLQSQKLDLPKQRQMYKSSLRV